NRTYEFPQGRFTQPDPIGSVKNLYVYGGNDPVNMIDPSGLAECTNGGQCYSYESNFAGWHESIIHSELDISNAFGSFSLWDAYTGGLGGGGDRTGIQNYTLSRSCAGEGPCTGDYTRSNGSIIWDNVPGLGLNGRGLTLFQGGRSPGQDFQPDPAVGIIIPRSPKFWGELMKLIASFLRGPWQQPPPPDPNLRIEMRQPQNPTVT